VNDESRLPLASWLRAAWADPAAGCPPPEAFLEAEAAVLTPAERRRLDEHAEQCPACAAERDLARLFDAAPAAAGVRPEEVAAVVGRISLPGGAGAAKAKEAEGGRVVPFPSRPRPVSVPSEGTVKARPARSWMRWAAAAVLVVGLGLMLQLLRPVAPPLPDPEMGGVRGGRIELLAPLGEVATAPAALRWAPVEGAAAYRVRLLAVDDEVLWEARATGPSVALPTEVAARLQGAVTYRWTVEALAADGSLLATGEPGDFRLPPNP
jgi:hypothetical protein